MRIALDAVGGDFGLTPNIEGAIQAVNAFGVELLLAGPADKIRAELTSRGIRVTVLCPGPVPTEFAARAGVTESLAPGMFTKTADDVAQAGYRGLMRGTRTVVPGLANKLVTLLVRVLPRRLVLRLVDARQSRRRSAQT